MVLVKGWGLVFDWEILLVDGWEHRMAGALGLVLVACWDWEIPLV